MTEQTKSVTDMSAREETLYEDADWLITRRIAVWDFDDGSSDEEEEDAFIYRRDQDEIVPSRQWKPVAPSSKAIPVAIRNEWKKVAGA